MQDKKVLEGRTAKMSIVGDDMLKLVPNMRAFAVSLCGDVEQADDLVQETLLKAWKHLDSFQEGTNLRAWLFTILRNTFITEIRRRRREVEDRDGEHAAALAEGPSQQGVVDLADLKRALELLPQEQRTAILLVGAAGFSYEEAAKRAQCAVGTIKSRVNRARQKLIEKMDSYPQKYRRPTSPDASHHVRVVKVVTKDAARELAVTHASSNPRTAPVPCPAVVSTSTAGPRTYAYRGQSMSVLTTIMHIR